LRICSAAWGCRVKSPDFCEVWKSVTDSHRISNGSLAGAVFAEKDI